MPFLQRLVSTLQIIFRRQQDNLLYDLSVIMATPHGKDKKRRQHLLQPAADGYSLNFDSILVYICSNVYAQIKKNIIYADILGATIRILAGK